MKKIIVTFILCMSIGNLYAQQTVTLSLKQCIETAIERNINVVHSRMDNQKASHKTAEARATLLPQVNASAQYTDNLKLSKIMLPGDMLGAPGTSFPVEMGVQHNATAGVALNQVLFNQTAYMGLKLSRKMEELNLLSVDKAEQSIAKEITNLYFLSQTTAEQVQIIKDNIERNEKIANITKVVVDNGFGKKVDYDRLIVNIENQYTQLSNVEALYQQQLNMMKYMLEIPIETSIVLTEQPSLNLIEEPLPIHDFASHVDMQLLDKQIDANELNQKMIKSQYLPSVGFNAQWGVTGMQNDFGDLFDGKWFNSYSIGLSLNIPIFDGLEKRSKSRQAKIDYDKAVMTYNNTQSKMEVDYQNALKDYYNNQKNVERQLQNINLAEKTYAETSLKYKEGIASMSDLLQDQTGLSNAQNNYLSALYNFKAAELELMSLNGQIKNLYTSN